MLFRRIVIATSVSATVILMGVWAAGFVALGQGRGGGATVTINADTAQAGQIVREAMRELDGTCAISPAIQIEGTLGDGELTEEVVIGIDGQCRTVILDVERTVEVLQGSEVMQSSGSTDWEAYTTFRLSGVYEEGGEEFEALAEAEVEFHLTEEDGEFSFNYPSPIARCVVSGFPTIREEDCDLEYNVNTATQKKLTNDARFKHHPVPDVTWDQTATYDAKVSGSDRYRCWAGPHPSYLESRCRGNRTRE